MRVWIVHDKSQLPDFDSPERADSERRDYYLVLVFAFVLFCFYTNSFLRELYSVRARSPLSVWSATVCMSINHILIEPGVVYRPFYKWCAYDFTTQADFIYFMRYRSPY